VVPLAEGFEEIEAVTIIDVLRRADVDVLIAGLSSRQVTGSHGITVQADAVISEIDKDSFDAVVLPGGMPGSRYLKESPAVIELVKSVSQRGGYTAAICAAPVVLGYAGVLKGKRATCFPGNEKDLEGAIYTGAYVEVDGKVITGKGAGASILFSLEVVTSLVGREKADELRKRMQVP
jgi:4-methyl-5(b-hydroxyethyl)-thiazole monophosphate biosynthesis